jgi:hypothetical protein
MPAHPYIRTRGVRWNKELKCFEMWCPDCAERNDGPTFHPLDEEFWAVDYGLARCRACWAEKKRHDEKNRRALKREAIIAANRAYYQDNRELLRWKDNQRKTVKRSAVVRVASGVLALSTSLQTLLTTLEPLTLNM